MSNLENLTHQGLERAFELITLLATTNVPMSVMEISSALKVTRTTAYVLVNSLMAQHCLERNPVTKRYSLGHFFYEIGTIYRYQFSFLGTVEKYINVMFDKWQFRINVSVLKPKATAVILLSKDSSLLPRMPNGYVLYAHATSAGKLLMAHHPEDIVEDWLQTINFPQLTPFTITDKDRLKEEFARIRERGYSFEFEELAPRRGCIAAPVRDMTGEIIAAVSFAGNLQQIKENFNALADDIVVLGNDISTELGYGSTFASPKLM
ncbi:MAG: IclR family transcriptional regulator [Synergistaceae bacterium]|nr:IclR family transcriptional regulator [Synergistaceae bacterium]